MPCNPYMLKINFNSNALWCWGGCSNLHQLQGLWTALNWLSFFPNKIYIDKMSTLLLNAWWAVGFGK